jgi:hypothetical protein
MLKKMLVFSALLVLTSNVIAADYSFPSPNPPANLKPSQVKQYVAFIFDDNQYSGENGTQYEDTAVYTYPASQNYAKSGFVGGISPDFTYNPPNPKGYHVGDFGISWAEGPLAGRQVADYTVFSAAETYTQGKKVSYNGHLWTAKYWTSGAAPDTGSSSAWTDNGPVPAETLTRKNPDGSAIHFTFNFISGLFVPIWGPDWTQYQSKFGYWVPKAIDAMTQTKIAVSWGREQMCGISEGDSSKARPFLRHVALRAISHGHEIGNHTIDHMETNSPLPKSYFDSWGGAGWDANGTDTMPWGEVISEATQFGQTVGASSQSMGWKYDAGQIIPKPAWKGLISLGEQQLDTYLSVSVAKGNLHGFRAPRLESDPGQFFALRELGYEYDCGLEEGYEENVDGTNFLWPYTTDNGSINAFTQKSNGEHMYLDSMPAGLWEIPSNCVIVPTALRKGIFAKYHAISAGAVGEDWTKNPTLVAQDSTEWCYGSGGGKITCLDFNMFVLWGLTKDEFIQTMVYNLKLRMAGGKAPFHYGCHPDYYTPIYDNATLQNAFNKDSYGLVVSKGWNTWKDRKAAVEAFLDSAIHLGAFVVSGHELVQQVKAMQAQDQVGTTVAFTPSWTFKAGAGSPTSSVATATGNLTAAVTFVGASDEGGFSAPVTAGALKNLDHVSLTYKSTAPLKLRLVLSGTSTTYDVLLNNCGPTVASGNIPISAFQKDTAGYSDWPATEKIIGIEIAPQNVNKAPANLSISNLAFYSGMTSVKQARLVSQALLNVGLVTSKWFMLSSPRAGRYAVAVYSVDGRLVQSIDCSIKTGINKVFFSKALVPTKYVVKITDTESKQVVVGTAVACGF